MITIIPNDIQQQALEHYLAVRQNTTENVPVTILHIDDQYSFMAQGTGADKPDNLWVFGIGAGKTATSYFYHNPPTPGEVENAIMVVEDEVMPLHKLLIPNSQLYSLDETVREIALLAAFKDSDQGMILTRTDMELVFNRLAAIITGRPASSDVLPADNSFASTLLILREVMHHLGFMEITILPLRE
jgi:exopolyphosphatase/pppGpp-phosphohydrolase